MWCFELFTPKAIKLVAQSIICVNWLDVIVVTFLIHPRAAALTEVLKVKHAENANQFSVYTKF